MKEHTERRKFLTPKKDMFVTVVGEHTPQESSIGCGKVTEHMHTITHTELQVKEAQTTEERLKEP